MQFRPKVEGSFEQNELQRLDLPRSNDSITRHCVRETVLVLIMGQVMQFASVHRVAMRAKGHIVLATQVAITFSFLHFARWHFHLV